MAKAKKHNVDMTTGIGTLSFPKVFADTKGTKDDGTPSYEIQIIIPKSDKKAARDLLKAIVEVGEAEWGERWKSVNNPLRDGDKEKDKIAEDGQTYGEKYPERLGCYFINARSQRPVAVVDRQGSPISDSSLLYGGCKGRISVSFYPYANNGNVGIGAGLNGVQKIADGEPFGGTAPAVEQMFDEIDLDDLDLDEADDEADDEAEVEKPKAKKKKKVKVDA